MEYDGKGEGGRKRAVGGGSKAIKMEAQEKREAQTVINVRE